MTPDHPPLEARLADATFVAIDTETTGMDPRRDRIVAVGAVRFRTAGDVLEETEVLVDPGMPISAASTAVHGIADADVRGLPPLERALPDVRAFIGDAVPVAHMGAFDLAFLQRPLRAARLPTIERMLDTAVLAARLLGPLPDLSLEALCAYFELPLEGRHTARGDARIASGLFLRLLPALHVRRAHTLQDALHWGDVTRGLSR